MQKGSQNTRLKTITSLTNPEDLVHVVYERNNCKYVWGIPSKNLSLLEKLNQPHSFEQLESLGGKLLNILIFNQHSIKFNSPKAGVRNLEVNIVSSETEDRQLLHKVSTELRAKQSD